MPTPKTKKGLKQRESQALLVKNTPGVLEEIDTNNGLTHYQKQFLEYMLGLKELPNTIQELVANGDIAKQTFYSWVKELSFLEAFNRVCDVIDSLDRPWIDAANRRAAKDGNIAAQRTYYLRRGLLGTNNQVNTQVNIDFSSLDSKVG